MNSSGNDTLDRRRVEDVHYHDILKWIDGVRGRHRDNPDFTAEMKSRLAYIEAVVSHGNCGGRSNPTMTLPVPFKVSDIEAVIGASDDPVPGSDAAWRGVRRHFDVTQSGRSAGRVR